MVIDFSNVKSTDIIRNALQYLDMLNTSLAKLVVYCSPSFIDDNVQSTSANQNSAFTLADIQFTVRRSQGTTGKPWQLRIDVPKTHVNMAIKNNSNKPQNSNVDGNVFRYVYGDLTADEVINMIQKKGKFVSQVELHMKGTKISAIKEVITLFYIPV